MDYSPSVFQIFRSLLFCLLTSYCFVSVLICINAYNGMMTYGLINPALGMSSLIALLVFLTSLYAIYSQLYAFNKNTICKSIAAFAMFFIIYSGVPIYEFIMSSRNRMLLKNPTTLNETFQRFSKYDPIDGIIVMRLQVDAKCCGYDDKNVWRVLGYDPNFPTTASEDQKLDERKRVYPWQCCTNGVRPCSNDNVFESGCKDIKDTLLPEVDARIQYRFDYALTMCLIYLGLFLLHMVLAYIYYDLLIGKFFKSIAGYNGSYSY